MIAESISQALAEKNARIAELEEGYRAIILCTAGYRHLHGWHDETINLCLKMLGVSSVEELEGKEK